MQARCGAHAAALWGLPSGCVCLAGHHDSRLRRERRVVPAAEEERGGRLHCRARPLQPGTHTYTINAFSHTCARAHVHTWHKMWTAAAEMQRTEASLWLGPCCPPVRSLCNLQYAEQTVHPHKAATASLSRGHNLRAFSEGYASPNRHSYTSWQRNVAGLSQGGQLSTCAACRATAF